MGKRWRELKDAAVAGVRVPDVNAGVDEGGTRVVRIFFMSFAAYEIVDTVPAGKRSKFVDAAIISASGS